MTSLYLPPTASSLFETNPGRNLLPFDGEVHYHGPVLNPCEAQQAFDRLIETVPWKHERIVIFGKIIQTARMVAWFGDAAFTYIYSGTAKTALPWTTELRHLKALVESRSGCSYNSCLCNLYHHGAEGMGWHSDDEAMLGQNSAIASLSLGAERKFCFRHVTKALPAPLSIWLENGSLLVMKGSTQQFWQHSLPKSQKIRAPRINLTFRTIITPATNEQGRF